MLKPFWLLLLLGFAISSYAQDAAGPAGVAEQDSNKEVSAGTATDTAQPAEPSETLDGAPKITAAAGTEAGTEAEAETPDSFDPTERVDEDYSLAFPVDI